MKKISIEQTFDHPLETLLRAREERYKHLDRFPELKNVSIVSEETVGEILKQVRHIDLGGSLPAVLVPILPTGADTLVETSEFDHTDNKHTFHVIPDGGNEKIFSINGVSRYYELEAGRSARNYEIEITSKAFLVSGVVETTIGEIYVSNLNKDQKSIEHFIEILKEEDSKSNDASSPETTDNASPSDSNPGDESTQQTASSD